MTKFVRISYFSQKYFFPFACVTHGVSVFMYLGLLLPFYSFSHFSAPIFFSNLIREEYERTSSDECVFILYSCILLSIIFNSYSLQSPVSCFYQIYFLFSQVFYFVKLISSLAIFFTVQFQLNYAVGKNVDFLGGLYSSELVKVGPG